MSLLITKLGDNEINEAPPLLQVMTLMFIFLNIIKSNVCIDVILSLDTLGCSNKALLVGSKYTVVFILKRDMNQPWQQSINKLLVQCVRIGFVFRPFVCTEGREQEFL